MTHWSHINDCRPGCAEWYRGLTTEACDESCRWFKGPRAVIAAEKERLAPLVSDDVRAAVASVAERYESDLRRLA